MEKGAERGVVTVGAGATGGRMGFSRGGGRNGGSIVLRF